MLSRRQFFSITVIMLVLLVMFQLTGVMKDYWNEYDKNKYAESIDLTHEADEAFSVNEDEEEVSENFCIFIGDSLNDNIGKMVKLWCQYTKRDLLTYESVEDINLTKLKDAEVLLIDSNYMDYENDTAVLKSYADDGNSMIFCNLPNTDEIKDNYPLRELLGIYALYGDVTIEGIDLYEGFLLGGRAIYEATNSKEEKMQDFDLDVSWFATYSGVKRYMVGLVPEDAMGNGYKVKNEDMPSLIWRNSIGKSRIFVVNGDYMEDVSALGILDAMMYEMKDYYIYPVVNAQNLVIADFAGLSSEFDDKMMDEYTRSQKAVYQDLIWPSLSSIYTNSTDKPTFFISPRLDYSDDGEADGEKLIYYMKLIKEADAESGMTLSQSSEIDLSKKIDEDKSVFNKYISGYEFTSIYAGDETQYGDQSESVLSGLTDLRTICLSTDYYDAPVEYTETGLTRQRATVEGFTHTYSDNFRLKSLQTALAYSSIEVDMSKILYSNDKEDSWENSSERLASNVITYWKPFKVFEKTVVTESDSRIRQFLNLTYEDVRNENIITVKIDELKNTSYFILRTHNESVEEVEGGYFDEIEEHAYLICAEEDTIDIKLSEDVSLYYYMEK